MASTPNFLSALASTLFSDKAVKAKTDSRFDLELAAAMAPLPIGGRVSACADAWRLITKSPWILRIMAEGYKINWECGPASTPY